MKGNEGKALWKHILKALDARRTQLGEERYGRIRPLLWKNYSSGRIERVLGKNKCQNPDSYVATVIEQFQAENETVAQLMYTQVFQDWEVLRKCLYPHAYQYLNRHTYLSYESCGQLADDCTQETMIALLEQDFPFDCVFLAWAKMITINKCRNAIRSAKKDSSREIDTVDIFAKNIVVTQQLIISPEEKISRSDQNNENAVLLANARAKLKEEQNYLLQEYFVKGRILKDIATEIGVAPSTIQRRLKKIRSQLMQNLKRNGYSSI